MSSARALTVVLDGDVSDDALARAFLAGERSAFDALVRRHQALVYRLVRRYARTREDAADLAQRAFLQAFEAAARTLPRLGRGQPVPFKAWLIRIALNLGKNHVRDAHRWPRAGAELLERQPSGLDAHAALERAQAEALARSAVEVLPPRQREVFTLRIDGGLPFAEVAAALGISEGNAKAHFHHAVKRLRDEVQARLAAPPPAGSSHGEHEL